MRGALSGLTTRGRCLLAAGIAAALCSLVLGERDLLRVAIFVLALPLLSSSIAARSRTALTARRDVRPPRVPVGEAAEVQIIVRGNGKLPTGGLLIEDGGSSAASRSRFVVDRLPRGVDTVLRYPVRPAQRGVHRVGPLLSKITDPFGLVEFQRRLATQDRLIVLPKVVDLFGLPGGSGLGGGDGGPLRLMPGQGEDDVVVRPYRQGDDLRKVHWRSTARHDEVMVRVEEQAARGGTTVLVDHRAAAHRGAGPDSSLEWAVSFAASICQHLTASGRPVRLVAADGQPLSGREHGERNSASLGETALLDALAMLTPTHRAEFSCGTDPGNGQEMIAILGSIGPTSVGELLRLRPRGIRSVAVLLAVDEWRTETERPAPPGDSERRLLLAGGWTVVTARPADAMASVWREVCHTGTGQAGRESLLGPSPAGG